jgi:hypothetical protein
MPKEERRPNFDRERSQHPGSQDERNADETKEKAEESGPQWVSPPFQEAEESGAVCRSVQQFAEKPRTSRGRRPA